jgi:uncharacterized protein YcbX
MGGEPAGAVRVDGRGVGGDRTYALYDVHRGAPRRLTVRQVPRLLRWRAAYPGAPDDAVDPGDPPRPTLTAPDGSVHAWDDAGLPGLLAADLGRPVELRGDLRGQQDLADSVLVTTQATLDALGAELGVALDLRRFRTNLHVTLDAPAWAEHGWRGLRMRVGEAELELLHPCERCVIPTRDPDTQAKWAGLLRHLSREHAQLFGINARPLGPATIRAGDRVELL